MANSTPISYLILKNPEDFNEKSSVIPQDEYTIIDNLAHKYRVDQSSGNVNANAKIWNEIAKEFMSFMNVETTGEALKRKWQHMKNIHTNEEEVKRLEASIAQELGSGQQFQIQQTEVGDKTETIVLLDSVVEEPKSKPNSNDLVSLALTESGIQENNQEEDTHYEQLADEILAAEQGDPAYAKKKLKWDRKFRVEESNFEARKKDIEVEIEAYKRDHDEAQIEISNFERLIKNKMQKLDEIRTEIKKYKS